MKIKKSDYIVEGDIVVVRDQAFRVARLNPNLPCRSQCHLLTDTGCTGTCLRWGNGDNYVFRYIGPAEELGRDTEVVELLHGIELYLRRVRETSLMDRHQKLKEKKENGKRMD